MTHHVKASDMLTNSLLNYLQAMDAEENQYQKQDKNLVEERANRLEKYLWTGFPAGFAALKKNTEQSVTESISSFALACLSACCEEDNETAMDFKKELDERTESDFSLGTKALDFQRLTRLQCKICDISEKLKTAKEHEKASLLAVQNAFQSIIASRIPSHKKMV